MISIADAALSYYALRMRWAERDYWALALKEWFQQIMKAEGSNDALQVPLQSLARDDPN